MLSKALRYQKSSGTLEESKTGNRWAPMGPRAILSYSYGLPRSNLTPLLLLTPKCAVKHLNNQRLGILTPGPGASYPKHLRRPFIVITVSRLYPTHLTRLLTRCISTLKQQALTWPLASDPLSRLRRWDARKKNELFPQSGQIWVPKDGCY
jgi:hypothetical protein